MLGSALVHDSGLRRLKAFHPDGLYAFGGIANINERWFLLRRQKASNGPHTLPDEGLSYVNPGKSEKFLLQAAVETAGDLLLGADVVQRRQLESVQVL